MLVLPLRTFDQDEETDPERGAVDASLSDGSFAELAAVAVFWIGLKSNGV